MGKYRRRVAKWKRRQVEMRQGASPPTHEASRGKVIKLAHRKRQKSE